MHKHKCDNCGNIWQHRASDFNGHDEYQKGHTCDKCGAEQYYKFHDGEFQEDARCPIVAMLEALLIR